MMMMMMMMMTMMMMTMMMVMIGTSVACGENDLGKTERG